MILPYICKPMKASICLPLSIAGGMAGGGMQVPIYICYSNEWDVLKSLPHPPTHVSLQFHMVLSVVIIV